MTVIYDNEAVQVELLIERLREACAGITPLALHLGNIAAFVPPHDGLYVATTASEGLAELRAAVLRSLRPAAHGSGARGARAQGNARERWFGGHGVGIFEPKGRQPPEV